MLDLIQYALQIIESFFISVYNNKQNVNFLM